MIESELKRIFRLQIRTLKKCTNPRDIYQVDAAEIAVTEFDQWYESLYKSGEIVSRNLIIEARVNHEKLLKFLGC